MICYNECSSVLSGAYSGSVPVLFSCKAVKFNDLFYLMNVIKLMNMYGRTFTIACSQTQAVACCFSSSNVSIE